MTDNYVKIGYIIDAKTQGDLLIISPDGEVQVNTLKDTDLPLDVLIEVVDWESVDEFVRHGKINGFYSETLTLASVSDPSMIREIVFNILAQKYSGLHI